MAWASLLSNTARSAAHTAAAGVGAGRGDSHGDCRGLEAVPASWRQTGGGNLE